MGIITEDPKPRTAQRTLDNTELVRPQSRRGASATLVLVCGRHSVALQRRCLVYRGVCTGRKVVNVVPLRSIDSFCLRVAHIHSILAAASVLLLMSVATGLWW